jgi:hypothetical protein
MEIENSVGPLCSFGREEEEEEEKVERDSRMQKETLDI